MSECISRPDVHNGESLVSICIPVYNAGKTIEKTLLSIVNQSYNNLEIIVVDNLSTDTTQKIVESFRDTRIRFIQNGEHFKVAEYNWNTCFQHAKGEYLALFHSDDIYDPHFVQKEITFLKKCPDIGAVFTSGVYIDENDNCIGKHKLPHQLCPGKLLRFNEAFILVLENWNFFLTPTAMVRSQLYKELSPFRYDQFRSSSDLGMWLRISERCPVVIIPEPLLQYRITRLSGSYGINFLRTGKADFFRVTEYYLSKYSNLQIPRSSLRKYYYLVLLDNLVRAKNLIKKGRYDESKCLLRQSLETKYVKLLLPGFNFKYHRVWISGLLYLAILKMSPELLNKLTR